ncbi:uncharacterized protein LOC123534516 [Mercenaria mercenaria]|uniref:uncharacterized protein LOC123534516 n=1 Tax=Mercenaria mercenaria TaxID=6596 RepID=UPI00234E66C4|nr:uncharacterized protein LOC123534516 [Mercenaria mercenaria]
MATNQPPAVLAREATEKNLQRIAKSVGSNWEMLGPYLLKQNAMAKVEQIKEDHHKTEMRIYNLLLTWRQQAAPDTTLGHLFHQMLQVGTSVTVEWRSIAKYLDIDERDIRACKKGYQPPVQERSTNLSIPDEQNSAQQFPVQATEDEPMEVDSDRRVTEKGKMEVDSGPVTEKGKIESDLGRVTAKEKMEVMEVDEEHGSEEKFRPSLEDRKHNKTCRPPMDACIFDGRLIKLEKKDISILEHVCVKEIGRGGFGKVYSSSDYSDESIPNGFGMHVAVKKIKVPDKENEDYIRSIRREMITSRIMHPFVLPLLAVVDRLQGNLEFWFVSPLCKNGDLHAAIKKGNVITREMTFVKILLHIALAIQYIHTAVPNVRDVILHKDISSKNVVLDDKFNARLIDFGLAREKDDETTNVKGKVYYLHPDFGKHGATESWDYYSFGVIIREVLTGLEPQGCGNKFLKFMEADEVERILKDLKEQKKCIWSANDRDIQLNSVAEKCLKQNDWKVEKFDTNVVQGIKKIWKDFGQNKILDLKDQAKCHICMINPKARETSMTQKHADNCSQKIEVCIACEKNSFLNPVTCYCGTELQPEIGSKYGALLVAGNDLKNMSVAEALTKDIKELKKLITSRAPRIMGMSERKVHTVVPRKPGEGPENLWPKVKECIDIFSEDKDIDTLLIYFSCHGAKNKGSGDAENNCFELGSESIAMTTFQKELKRLDNIDKLVIVLDRCHPSRIKFQDGRKFIQINACKENQKADITDEGSIFTKYLVQGLKANSEGKRCADNCQCCNDYWAKRTDFITVQSLYDYVKHHMRKVSPTIALDLQGDSSNIAFYTDDQVLIEFEDCTGTKKDVPLEYLQNIEQLESKLFKMFEKEDKVNKVRILRHTYRKEKDLEECDTLEKVMSAWVHRQPLKVKFEPV